MLAHINIIMYVKKYFFDKFNYLTILDIYTNLHVGNIFANFALK